MLSSAFENEAKAFVRLLLQEVILPEMGFWGIIIIILYIYISKRKQLVSSAFEHEAKAFVGAKGE